MRVLGGSRFFEAPRLGDGSILTYSNALGKAIEVFGSTASAEEWLNTPNEDFNNLKPSQYNYPYIIRYLENI